LIVANLGNAVNKTKERSASRVLCQQSAPFSV
jgi:hypothetical protein